MVKTKHKSRLNRKTWFDYIDIVLLFFIGVVTLYPFWNVLMISLNNPVDTLQGGVTLWFRDFTLDNFRFFFARQDFVNAFIMSVARTVLGASASVLFTSAYAYGLSKTWLVGRKFFVVMLMITMYFSGGMIPTFLLVTNLGLYQNFMVYILLPLIHSYHVIIMISFFRSIPAELEESVRIDGGNDLVIFFRIIFPVSMPMIATITLFSAVGQWNSWFDTLLYGGRELMTLQMKLVEIIRDANQARELMSSGSPIAAALAQLGYKPNVESVKATAMMVTAIPIVLIYPFLQRYFVKGIMIGSLKG